MSIFLIGFLLLVGVLGEPNIYWNLLYFTRIGDFTWNFLERDQHCAVGILQIKLSQTSNS